MLSILAIWSKRAKANTIECVFWARLSLRSRPANVRPVLEPKAMVVYAITTVYVKSTIQPGRVT